MRASRTCTWTSAKKYSPRSRKRSRKSLGSSTPPCSSNARDYQPYQGTLCRNPCAGVDADAASAVPTCFSKSLREYSLRVRVRCLDRHLAQIVGTAPGLDFPRTIVRKEGVETTRAVR